MKIQKKIKKIEGGSVWGGGQVGGSGLWGVRWGVGLVGGQGGCE